MGLFKSKAERQMERRIQIQKTLGMFTKQISKLKRQEEQYIKTARDALRMGAKQQLALAKRAAFQTAEIRAGRWTRRTNLGLQGKVLGILGTGHTGAEMARLGRALDMEVIAWTFHPSPQRAEELGLRFVELDELLRRADVVSLHLRLSAETRELIGPRELELLKDGALLLNGARGEIVDLDALAEALRGGRLGGAALDVFPVEPFADDHPILSCEQVVLTPHAADMTPEGMELLNEGAVDNVIAFLEGRERNNVAV